MKIGKYTLKFVDIPHRHQPPYNEKSHVWISLEGGEGMAVSEDALEKVIDNFYMENF